MLYRAILCGTVKYTVQQSAVHCSTVNDSAIQCMTMQKSAVQFIKLQYSKVLSTYQCSIEECSTEASPNTDVGHRPTFIEQLNPSPAQSPPPSCTRPARAVSNSWWWVCGVQMVVVVVGVGRGDGGGGGAGNGSFGAC